MYMWRENEEICLKNLASELRTERRRVYDIVNILEAFDVLAKKAKNVYLWRGMEEFKGKLLALTSEVTGECPSKLFNFEHRPVRSKKKMLTYMSLKVLRFFGEHNGPISFSEIVRLCLCSDSQKDYLTEKRASTTRRLYDIVNVLNALGLISKVYDSQHKKFYKWNGTEGMMAQIDSHYGRQRRADESMAVQTDSHSGKQRRGDEVPSLTVVPFPAKQFEFDENHQQLNSELRIQKFQSFQPVKESCRPPEIGFKRLLSFSESEGRSTGKSSGVLRDV